MSKDVYGKKLKFYFDKYIEIEKDLQVQSNNHSKIAELLKERNQIEEIYEVAKKYFNLVLEIENTEEMIKSEANHDMVNIINQEIKNLHNQLHNLEVEVKKVLIPKDKNDSKDVILEIRAGTGGEEAALFATKLLRMYEKYCSKKNFIFDIISLDLNGIGGTREAIMSISGNKVFAQMKFESGVHRVQRVPETENKGRVHTSTASVIVLPQIDDSIDLKIDEKDLRIDVYRSSGAGGQSVNKTESAVRITHMPSGIVVAIQDEKSQIQNRKKAMSVLRARLYEMEELKRQQDLSKEKKNLVKTGDRNEKIRTYNFPQNRLTDHRINYSTNLTECIESGDLQDLISQLKISEEINLLQEIE